MLQEAPWEWGVGWGVLSHREGVWAGSCAVLCPTQNFLRSGKGEGHRPVPPLLSSGGATPGPGRYYALPQKKIGPVGGTCDKLIVMKCKA